MTKLQIKLRAYDVSLLESNALKIMEAAKIGKAKVSGPIPMPTKINRYTILRSPHLHKKSREQFEQRTHKRLLILEKVNSKLLDKLKRLELSSGVHYEINVQ